jgi:hypothetical protein
MKLPFTSTAVSIVTSAEFGDHNNRMNCFEHVRDSPNLNVCCGLLHDRVVGPFFLWKELLLRDTYLDLLEQFVFLQVDDIERENATGGVFQQDGAPPHFSLQVRLALNAMFPNRWIGSLENFFSAPAYEVL